MTIKLKKIFKFLIYDKAGSKDFIKTFSNTLAHDSIWTGIYDNTVITYNTRLKIIITATSYFNLKIYLIDLLFCLSLIFNISKNK